MYFCVQKIDDFDWCWLVITNICFKMREGGHRVECQGWWIWLGVMTLMGEGRRGEKERGGVSNVSLYIWLNAFHAAGECRRQVKYVTKFVKKCRNCEISCPYLKPQRKMYSDKYKQAWYWFINSWNSRWNFRNVSKLKLFCSLKPMPSVVSVNHINHIMYTRIS